MGEDRGEYRDMTPMREIRTFFVVTIVLEAILVRITISVVIAFTKILTLSFIHIVVIIFIIWARSTIAIAARAGVDDEKEAGEEGEE